MNGRHEAITETVPAWEQWWRDDEPDSRPSYRCGHSCGYTHLREASIAAFFWCLSLLALAVLAAATHLFWGHP